MKVVDLLAPGRWESTLTSGLSVTSGGTLLDSRAFEAGKGPMLAWDPSTRSWAPFRGLLASHAKSCPVTADEARAIMSGDRELLSWFQRCTED